MTRDRIIFLLTCLAVSVFGEWPTYHGAADLRGVADVALPEQPALLWRYDAGGAIGHAPVSDGEHIFFSAKKGKIVAIDLEGSEVWKKNLMRTNDAGAEMPVQFEAPLACGGGLVFAGTLRGSVYALDAKTGEEKWRYETGGIFVGSPNMVSNLVVVLDQSEGALHGVDIETGKLAWKTEGVERCDGSPGIGDGRVVFGSCAAALHVYSASDGMHLKNIELGGDAQVAGGVAVDGNLVFAGVRDGSMVCADAATGEMIWSSDESTEQTFSTPAVTPNAVVYSSDNGFVYAVDREVGKLLWKFDAGGLPGSPVIAKDKVVISSDGTLYLLDLKDGKKLWAKEISDEITSPAIINGMIVVGADDGTVRAFGSKK
ncbi:MAG: PQQ-binding-like beta-propeller repeat protein [Kiritimatiellales bacterium]|nr:PQQ-binding-like beta-propeller repeat protein [Kiritimatiellales bacterium]MCF7864092.1 PQQ-binding-like beta-propeller repeat protein [Kiritimatiellales bacterium]